MNITQDSNTCLPGIKPVLEILQTHPEKIDLVMVRSQGETAEIHAVQKLCDKAGIRVQRVPAAVLDKLCLRKGSSKGIQHQGIVARLVSQAFVSMETLLSAVQEAPLPLIVALDQVQDPGNIGTLARSLYALGGAGLLLPAHQTATIGPAAQKTAAGALEHLAITRVSNLAHALDDLEEKGFTLYGTACEIHSPNRTNAFTMTWDLPAVLVLGNEARGIRQEIAKRCHTHLFIPQARKFDSLNVAQAGAILLGLAAQQYFSENNSLTHHNIQQNT